MTLPPDTQVSLNGPAALSALARAFGQFGDFDRFVAGLQAALDGSTPFERATITLDRGWLGAVTNCFLIRDPREVIVSYIKKNNDPTLEDIGFVQQAEIFDWARAHTGEFPPVVDAHDILENPERILRLLCEAIGVEFSEAMLSWPPGLRKSDGIWAKHWYGEVVSSTGFREPSHRPAPSFPERLRDVYDRSRESYDRLYVHRLRSKT